MLQVASSFIHHILGMFQDGATGGGDCAGGGSGDGACAVAAIAAIEAAAAAAANTANAAADAADIADAAVTAASDTKVEALVCPTEAHGFVHIDDGVVNGQCSWQAARPFFSALGTSLKTVIC